MKPRPATEDDWRAKSVELLAELKVCGLEVASPFATELSHYCQLLWTWNEKLNLTRHTDFERFASRDVMDSVQLAAFLADGEEILDVGTGGGVPGVVLAIIRPDLDVALCESVAKKAKAIDEIVGRLGLQVPVYHARAEDLLEDLRFDTLVARAVGPLWKLGKWFGPHRAMFRRVLAIKGPSWMEERAEARHRGTLQGFELRREAAYPMPGTDSESVILSLSPKT